MNWMEGLQAALEYIEENLTEEIRAEDVAAQAYVSGFHFQRIFSALCGVTLGEYIRCRRLTLAAEELSGGDAKVIDVALKYGYDSPDSFARAFARFHGISPSAAKEKGARLNAFAPLRMKMVLEGGGMMEYRIVEKAAFTVMGVTRQFRSETAHQDIPVFWDEHLNGPMADRVRGVFGLCLDCEQDRFDYMIADSYAPWLEIPEGCATYAIPAGTWAVFPCRGEHPEALQRVDTCIWKEWLPGCREYRLGGDYNVEFYAAPDYSEIWVPVVKA